MFTLTITDGNGDDLSSVSAGSRTAADWILPQIQERAATSARRYGDDPDTYRIAVDEHRQGCAGGCRTEMGLAPACVAIAEHPVVGAGA
ncbi:hypothetical protein [Prauserella endophytica]|uniref:Uncharacterized protein n=1 Tax=Prauserella endophytica TaxID=1592324 RepID=A0ABY2RW49_9PSEU|nr:hypothetical protein [Prauserella endophytica]TKG61553.1 hypothetical protein FCN18_33480 [Prauserella endophytica]